MKRDMDLAREILLQVERSHQTMGWIDLELSDRDEGEVSYHIMLLAQAGLLDATNVTGNADLDWRPLRLTWQGHEFLDAAREEGRWAKAKGIMTEKVGGLSFEVMKALLIQLMRGKVLDGLE